MKGHNYGSLFPQEKSNSAKIKSVLSTSKSKSVEKLIIMKQDGKYKTELCKNWIKAGHCQYRKRCKFAHGIEEQIPIEKV